MDGISWLVFGRTIKIEQIKIKMAHPTAEPKSCTGKCFGRFVYSMLGVITIEEPFWVN